MVSWNEILFAASGPHDQLVFFSSITIINKKFIEYEPSNAGNSA